MLFLDAQKEWDGAVQSYSFVSPSFGDLFKQVTSGYGNSLNTYISTACGYNQAKTDIYAVQENYLNVIDLEYYMPSEIESGLTLPYLPNGETDSIAALFSEQNLSPYNGNKDIHNISVQLDPVPFNNLT